VLAAPELAYFSGKEVVKLNYVKSM